MQLFSLKFKNDKIENKYNKTIGKTSKKHSLFTLILMWLNLLGFGLYSIFFTTNLILGLICVFYSILLLIVFFI